MGRNSVADLFRGIPDRFKLKRPLTPPPALSETGTLDFFRYPAERNTIGHSGDSPFLRASKVKARIRCWFHNISFPESSSRRAGKTEGAADAARNLWR